MPHLLNPNTDQQAPQGLAGFLKSTHKVSHKEAVQTYQQAQQFVYGQCDECHGEGEIHHSTKDIYPPKFVLATKA